MVRFRINKELDISIASAFLGKTHAGVDFGKGVWGYHSELKGLTKKDTEKISNYVDHFYQKNEEKLENVCKKFQRQWEDVEENFINKTTRLFGGFHFPKGDYIGFISIFNCNPRFLQDKTFQVFFKEGSCVRLVSHELMHFIFYSFTESKLSDLVKGLDTNRGPWWDVAEVFNNVVLSSDELKKILHTDGDKGYPAHIKYISKADKLYKSSKNIEEFIRRLFQLIKLD